MNRRRHRLVLATGLTAVLALSACSSSDSPDAASPVSDPTTGSSETSAPAETTPAQPEASTPAPTTTTPAPAPTSSRPTFDLKAVQAQLKELRYYAGAVDGESGTATQSAVMAFQKVNKIGADGTIGPQTLAALRAPKAPALRSTMRDGVEVDLTKQVLYVIKGGAIERIMPVSSGNGEKYSQKDGDRATALTPEGYFTIQRRIVGLREADLGSLYDPQYYYKGWAIHGSNSVPPYPASHGCVRVTRADAKYLLEAINVGTKVYLYGGSHTFKAGSSAPGTDNPTGDEATPTTPTSVPTTQPAPTTSAPTATRTPTSTPTLPAPTVTPSPKVTLGG